MASLTYNQFRKEINNRISDPQVAYMMTLLFEMLAEALKQTDLNATVLTKVVESVQNVVHLNEALKSDMAKLAAGQKLDGIVVNSVAIDPNEFDKN